MRRREFISLLGGTAVAWSLAAREQQTVRMPRIGVLLAEEDDRDLQARLAGLRQGLERLGWLDGRNVRVDYRFGDGKPSRYQPLAKELVALQPDVIVAQSPPVVAAVQRETGVIPTVFVDVSDPIGPGFVASLARPGRRRYLRLGSSIFHGRQQLRMRYHSKAGPPSPWHRAQGCRAKLSGVPPCVVSFGLRQRAT
jgi:ABC-type uncharacterized transport system substrate-binding protein